MARYLTEKEFEAGMRERLARARQDAGFSQKEMAERIGVTAEAYAKYENRSVLPPHLIPRVCDVLEIGCWFLLTGRMTQDLVRPLTQRAS